MRVPPPPGYAKVQLLCTAAAKALTAEASALQAHSNTWRLSARMHPQNGAT